MKKLWEVEQWWKASGVRLTVRTTVRARTEKKARRKAKKALREAALQLGAERLGARPRELRATPSWTGGPHRPSRTCGRRWNEISREIVQIECRLVPHGLV